MANAQLLVGLTASLLGGAVVAIITYLTSRKKVSAEVGKLHAEAEKTRAETQKILAETHAGPSLDSNDDLTPKGWFKAGTKPRDYECGVDRLIVFSGRASGYLRAHSKDPQGFCTLMQTFKADDYRGKRAKLSAFVRTKGAESAALWMRVDGGPGNDVQAFDNMDDRPIKGTVDWRQYCIVLDITIDAKEVSFGLILSGAGSAWIDEVAFETVDRETPTTGMPTASPAQPQNLDFEEA